MTELRRSARVQRPMPVPNETTAPFWEAARHRILALQRCSGCSRLHHPPLLYCPECHSNTFEWTEVSGKGTVWSYTIMRQARVVGFEDMIPYACMAVEIDEQPGVLVLGNLVEADPESVRVGMRVEVRFEPIGDDGMLLPQFAPAAEGA
jgi:uncharacterized OB-fold protein